MAQADLVGARIADASNPSYRSAGLTFSASYTYWVPASNALGNVSPKSTSVTKTTQPSVSRVFAAGGQVQNTGKANVRSDPSGSGTVLGAQPRGVSGKVTGSPWYWNAQWWWKTLCGCSNCRFEKQEHTE